MQALLYLLIKIIENRQNGKKPSSWIIFKCTEKSDERSVAQQEDEWNLIS